ncbi:MAG TPA: hypothetical protein DCQ98_16180, partial [Planctomycetaceae bacterium]|nr:hypothetical protein [Planctomycetaceae bacterium]
MAPARPEPWACDGDTETASLRFDRSALHGRASGTTRTHDEATVPDRPNQPEAKRRDQPIGKHGERGRSHDGEGVA